MKNLFDDVIASVRSTCHEIEAHFTKTDADWVPVANLYSEAQRKVHVVALSFQNDADKDATAYALASAVPKFDVDVVAFVMSSWMVTVSSDSISTEDARKIKASRHPDRREILLTCVVSADREYSAYAPIIREENKPPRLGEWQEMGHAFESRIIDPVQAAMVAHKRKGARTDA